ncbi:MAG: preprotein translocase subunit YajC [Defluviitaleaceae bacterium]|nr:preprotein translocase subunit YajC [Defluviitaleaceae bacterium]
MFSYHFYNLTLMLNTVIVGGEGGPVAPAAPAAPAGGGELVDAGGAAAGGFFGGDMMTMILIYAAVIGGMWFLMIRPQRKREKALRQMQSELKVGDDVLTSSGLYGRIVSMGEDSYIVEFGMGKGIRVPVQKAAIVGNKAPGVKE